MSQHTLFLKSKSLYYDLQKLYEKLDKFEKNEISLSDAELNKIQHKIDLIECNNKTDYDDLFRTNKRNEDNTYLDTVITSREECFEFINNPENLVSFKHTITDTDVQEKINRKKAIKEINQFWKQYPWGLIYFG